MITKSVWSTQRHFRCLPTDHNEKERKVQNECLNLFCTFLIGFAILYSNVSLRFYSLEQNACGHNQESLFVLIEEVILAKYFIFYHNQ